MSPDVIASGVAAKLGVAGMGMKLGVTGVAMKLGVARVVMRLGVAAVGMLKPMKPSPLIVEIAAARALGAAPRKAL